MSISKLYSISKIPSSYRNGRGVEVSQNFEIRFVQGHRLIFDAKGVL